MKTSTLLEKIQKIEVFLNKGNNNLQQAFYNRIGFYNVSPLNKFLMHTFTQEELIQYLYHETSDEKTAAIKAALEENWELREAYDTLASTQKQLEDVKLSPREETIRKILDHAEKSIVLLHPH